MSYLVIETFEWPHISPLIILGQVGLYKVM